MPHVSILDLQEPVNNSVSLESICIRWMFWFMFIQYILAGIFVAALETGSSTGTGDPQLHRGLVGVNEEYYRNYYYLCAPWHHGT